MSGTMSALFDAVKLRLLSHAYACIDNPQPAIVINAHGIDIDEALFGWNGRVIAIPSLIWKGMGLASLV